MELSNDFELDLDYLFMELELLESSSVRTVYKKPELSNSTGEESEFCLEEDS